MQLRPTSERPADIRRRNRHTVLSLLRQHGALSKSDLVKLTERTGTTISTILDGLLEERLVALVSDSEPSGAEAGRGRPATFYALNAHNWIIAGLQIASNSVTVAVVNLLGEVLDSGTLTAPADMPSENVLDLAGSLLDSLLARTRTPESDLLGLGIALEGLVDIDAGKSLWMLFRQQWNDVPVTEYFAERYQVPVLIDYRVYAATLAEAVYGAGRGVSDFAYLNIDTGVAVASVASGRLVRSGGVPTGFTGGLGHVLRTSGSRLCYCGNTGCLQTEITTQALLTQLRELLDVTRGSSFGNYWQRHDVTFENLMLAAQQNDTLALQLRSRFAQNVAIAVSGTVQLFSGNLVIVGGAAAQFGGEEALEVSRRALQRLTILHSQFGLTKIVASTLLPDPATLGAASLVIQAVMDGKIAALPTH